MIAKKKNLKGVTPLLTRDVAGVVQEDERGWEIPRVRDAPWQVSCLRHLLLRLRQIQAGHPGL